MVGLSPVGFCPHIPSDRCSQLKGSLYLSHFFCTAADVLSLDTNSVSLAAHNKLFLLGNTSTLFVRFVQKAIEV